MENKKKLGIYAIYQLKDTPENRYLMFESYDRMIRYGNEIKFENYDKVYSADLYEGENLDSIYERFNWHHPDGFIGHSLSVSDVVVLHVEGQDKAYYVDSFGFKRLPEFFADNFLEKVEEMLEDDYGMLDGIINNGGSHKGDAEKKNSLMDKLKEKKNEVAVDKNNALKQKEAIKNQKAELN